MTEIHPAHCESDSTHPQAIDKPRRPSQSSGDSSEWVEPKPTQATPSPDEKEATKMLDELFRKTKSTPCVYWLPLTDAEVSRYYVVIIVIVVVHM